MSCAADWMEMAWSRSQSPVAFCHLPPHQPHVDLQNSFQEAYLKHSQATLSAWRLLSHAQPPCCPNLSQVHHITALYVTRPRNAPKCRQHLAESALPSSVPISPVHVQAGDAARALAAARMVSDLFGPLALHIAATTPSLEGLDPVRALLPAMTQALSHGPTHHTPAGDRGPSLVVRKRSHQAWRRQRARLALDVGALLGGLADPLKVRLLGPFLGV